MPTVMPTAYADRGDNVGPSVAAQIIVAFGHHPVLEVARELL
jgi:hypothetical protein